MPFQKVLKAAEVPEGEVRKAVVGNREFAVLRKAGVFYCLDGLCTHEAGPLGEGSLDGDWLVCPWHEGRYNAQTGEADPETDWITDAKTFRIKSEEGDLYIDL